MSSVGHFSVQFAGLEECPEPFRDRLRHFLGPSEAVFEIIYSPAFMAEETSRAGWLTSVTEVRR